MEPKTNSNAYFLSICTERDEYKQQRDELIEQLKNQLTHANKKPCYCGTCKDSRAIITKIEKETPK